MERSNCQVLDLSCSLPQIKTSYASSPKARDISSLRLVCPSRGEGHAGSRSTSRGYRCTRCRLSHILCHLHRCHRSDLLYHPFLRVLKNRADVIKYGFPLLAGVTISLPLPVKATSADDIKAETWTRLLKKETNLLPPLIPLLGFRSSTYICRPFISSGEA